MTFFYGSKKFGFTRQIEAFLKEREDYRDIKAHLIQGEGPSSDLPVATWRLSYGMPWLLPV